MLEVNKIYQGDCLEVLKTFPDECVDCIVTSPPYWKQRDYGVSGQLGLEENYLEFIENLCNIFDEVYRVLKKSGSCFVNLGDTYFRKYVNDKAQTFRPKQAGKYKRGYDGIKVKNNGGKEKSLCLIPERFAIEMTARDWLLRNTIIWHKPNKLPESVKDRFTVDFEKIFFFTKSKNYHFEQQFEPHKTNNKKDRMVSHRAWDNDPSCARGAGEKAIMKFNPLGRNKRSVWSIHTKPCPEAHFAAFPEELINPMILAGCPEAGIVLDPFMGAGTTAVAAKKLNRNYVGIELNPDYIKISEKRINETYPQLKLAIKES
ncbi:MAG: hypothetical protein A2104_00090 [Candidatus Melainabacteria bacterium GWF2_32_7]|nr:MAG: hypothetical protein A2104_00090 [Candidatus Melainabacteria bacterium GWF2_32_7]